MDAETSNAVSLNSTVCGAPVRRLVNQSCIQKSWQEGAEIIAPSLNFFLLQNCRKSFSKCSFKMQNLGLTTHILGDSKTKIKIFSTHNLFYRKYLALW